MKRHSAIAWIGLVLLSQSAAAEFFPAGVFAERADVDQKRAEYLQERLGSFGETTIYGQRDGVNREIYRFTWLRSFHRPVVFRVEIHSDDRGDLIIKIGDHPAREVSDPGPRVEKRTINRFQIGHLRATFAGEKGFFALPSFDEVEGLDGAVWHVEALVKGRYHIVTRWSPDSGAIRRIGMQFIEMAIGGDLTPIY